MLAKGNRTQTGTFDENMLVEFALYAGNDYTHEFPKTKFVVKADGEEGACYELDVGNVRFGRRSGISMSSPR